MDRARAPIATVEALTDAGRDYALANLKHLAGEKLPAGVTGAAVRPYREDLRRGREKAEEVAAARAARNPGLNHARGGSASASTTTTRH